MELSLTKMERLREKQTSGEGKVKSQNSNLRLSDSKACTLKQQVSIPAFIYWTPVMLRGLWFTYFALLNSFEKPMMMKITIGKTYNAYYVSLTVIYLPALCTHTHVTLTVIIGVDNSQVHSFIIREGRRTEDGGSKGLSPRDHTNVCSLHSPLANGL